MGEGHIIWALLFSIFLHGGLLAGLFGSGLGGELKGGESGGYRVQVVAEESAPVGPISIEQLSTQLRAEATLPEPVRVRSSPQNQRRAAKTDPQTSSIGSRQQTAAAAPDSGNSIDSAGGIGGAVPVALLDLPKPKYPEFARRHGQEGRVVFDVAISSSGLAEKINLVQSSGFSLLDQAAYQALSRARFSPAQLAGVPARSNKKLAFVFSLKEE